MKLDTYQCDTLYVPAHGRDVGKGVRRTAMIQRIAKPGEDGRWFCSQVVRILQFLQVL